MSMEEVIKMMEKPFKEYMNEPEQPKDEAYISYDKTNAKWVTCPFCGKKQFPVNGDTIIMNLVYRCKGSGCKKDFKVNVY